MACPGAVAGPKVFSQATHGDNIRVVTEKLERLSRYGDGGVRLYFLASETVRAVAEGFAKSTFISIEDVFDEARDRKPSQPAMMLHGMVGNLITPTE